LNKEQLAPGIFMYSDACENFEKLSSLIYSDDLRWYPALIASNRDPSEEITNISPKHSKEIRDCLSVPMLYEKADIEYFSSLSPDEEPADLWIEIHDIIRPMFDKIEKDYLVDHKIDYMTWHSRLEILKYEAGHFFENHIDNIPGISRTVSVVYYLNDDYEGGELFFERFNLKIKPKPNSMIVFPSNYVYNHSAEPVISGTKIAIASFLA